MVKQFTYRGLTQKELEGLSLENLLKLLPARARRSLTRGVNDGKGFIFKRGDGKNKSNWKRLASN